MFGTPIILAALSLVGAPQTPTRCNPAMPANMQGSTYWDNGNATASLVELDPEVCAGLLLLSASDTERRAIVALNGPTLNVGLDEGVAAETVLVEAIHTTHAYNGTDETDDACRAMSLLPSLLGRYLSGDALASALRWATMYYTAQPSSVYHTHPC